MEVLKSMLGEDSIIKIVSHCENILRDLYKVYEKNGSGFKYFKLDSKEKRNALNLLYEYNYIKGTVFYHTSRGYRISEKGKEFFNKNFRKNDEYFSEVDKWRIESRKAKLNIH